MSVKKSEYKDFSVKVDKYEIHIVADPDQPLDVKRDIAGVSAGEGKEKKYIDTTEAKKRLKALGVNISAWNHKTVDQIRWKYNPKPLLNEKIEQAEDLARKGEWLGAANKLLGDISHYRASTEDYSYTPKISEALRGACEKAYVYHKNNPESLLGRHPLLRRFTHSLRVSAFANMAGIDEKDRAKITEDIENIINPELLKDEKDARLKKLLSPIVNIKNSDLPQDEKDRRLEQFFSHFIESFN